VRPLERRHPESRLWRPLPPAFVPAQAARPERRRRLLRSARSQAPTSRAPAGVARPPQASRSPAPRRSSQGFRSRRRAALPAERNQRRPPPRPAHPPRATPPRRTAAPARTTHPRPRPLPRRVAPAPPRAPRPCRAPARRTRRPRPPQPPPAGRWRTRPPAQAPRRPGPRRRRPGERRSARRPHSTRASPPKPSPPASRPLPLQARTPGLPAAWARPRRRTPTMWTRSRWLRDTRRQGRTGPYHRIIANSGRNSKCRSRKPRRKTLMRSRDSRRPRGRQTIHCRRGPFRARRASSPMPPGIMTVGAAALHSTNHGP